MTQALRATLLILGLCSTGVARAQELEALVDRVKDSVKDLAPTDDAKAEEGESPKSTAPAAMHRYVDRNGRVVYTNIQEQVPIEQRVAAKVDLSRVSLNTELGNEIERRLKEQHNALIETPYCQRARQDANRDFLLQLWEDYSPLIICAGALLLFLLYSPAAIKRFGAPIWSKTLMTAIPALSASGLIAFSMMQTNETISGFKNRAAPCEASTFDKLSLDQDPVTKHAQLIEQLKSQIAQIDAEAGYRQTQR